MSIKTRLQDVLTAEATAIGAVQVTDDFEEAVRWLIACKGKVVAIGIGKAGHVAAKFAGTLSATGTPAVFLHAAEAAHGDLGVLSQEDVLVAFSTSGESREVWEAVQFSRRLGVTRAIGITSAPSSELGNQCDLILDMGPVEEACPLGLTATCSTTVMLAIGDAIAIATMEARHFTREDFAKRHAGGALGQTARKGKLPAA